jgi:hypothetical protein
MPISTSIDESRDLTIFTVKGELTFQEEMETLKAFYSGEPTANVLWDFRLLEGERISLQELEAVSDFIKTNQSKRPQGKTALVVANELDYGLSRASMTLYEIRNVSLSLMSFRSMDEALKWIDGEIVWDKTTYSFSKA